MRLLTALAFSAVVCAAGAAGAATPIAGLYNTGTDALGFALPGGDGVIDPHYLVVSDSSASAPVPYSPVTYYNGAYVADDANSRWISQSRTGDPGNDTVIYSLAFTLTAAQASSASITGSWGVDNEGEIFLNGVTTGNQICGATCGVIDLPGDFAAFQTLTTFGISSGFHAGVNTLEFHVLDLGPPGALRVDDLAGFAAAGAAVPEPMSWALMIAGFGGVGAALRGQRRRRFAVA